MCHQKRVENMRGYTLIKSSEINALNSALENNQEHALHMSAECSTLEDRVEMAEKAYQHAQLSNYILVGLLFVIAAFLFYLSRQFFRS